MSVGRPILLIAALLIWAWTLCAQPMVPRSGTASGSSSGCTGPGDTAALAYLATQTGLNATQTGAYTKAICDLYAAGFFPGGANPLVGLYFFGNANAANYKVNVITPGTFNLTEHGTCALTPSIGVQGDQSTCYEDPGFIPSSAGTAYTLNSASIFQCTLNARVSPTGAPVAIGGESNGTDYSYLSTYNPALITQGAMNSAPPGGIGQEAPVTSSQGLSLLFRNSTTAATFLINGARSDNISTSTTLTAVKLVIFAFNANGTIGSFSPDQFAYAGFGGGLGANLAASLVSAALFRSIMSTMIVTLGAPNVC